MNHIDLNTYGLRVVDFQSIFTKAYKNIVNDLFMYDKFHDHNVRSQDTKKIYYYHTIKQICDDIIVMNTDNKIVLYYCEKDVKCDFQKVTNKQTRKGKKDNRPEFILFMNRFFKQIKNIIPVRVFFGKVKFNTFIQYYNTNKGKYLETINEIRSIKRPTRFDFSKFKQFTMKYKLIYLTEQYINQVKVKSIMYK
jgi:hypothetical protein